MNEQINTLAEQAGLTKKRSTTGATIYTRAELQKKRQLQKFAELIVRECANIAAKNQAENMGWDISKIIKEHFGVEE
jgi:hypothetical protein